jgi:hypothetical protein
MRAVMTDRFYDEKDRWASNYAQIPSVGDHIRVLK